MQSRQLRDIRGNAIANENGCIRSERARHTECAGNTSFCCSKPDSKNNEDAPHFGVPEPHQRKKMKKKQDNSLRASALQITLALGLISVSAILIASSLTSSAGAANGNSTTAGQPDTPMPDVVQLIGPVSLNQDLRALPYI